MPRTALLPLLLALLPLAVPSAAASQVADSAAVAAAIDRRLAAAPGPVGEGGVVARRTRVAPLYDRHGRRPLWTAAGRPTAQARALVAELARADERGLAPDDYDAAALRRDAGRLAAGPPADPEALARFDVALSRAALRFVAELHAGRTDPRAVRFHLPDAHAEVDVVALVLALGRAADVPAAVATAEPPYAGYAALVRALRRYRALAADPAVAPLPAGPRRPAVRPGDRYPDAPALRRLLAALGDLPAADAAAADSVLAGPLVDAVTAFQRRHGLEPDGILGPATLGQLRVPLARRVRQLELTLERWRWLPDRPPPRYAVVNVPAFRLYAFADDLVAGRPALSVGVIVGEAAGSHDTPVFVGTMRHVVFRPYWDVPPSIARQELLPRIRRDRGYLERERLEIVRGGDDDAVVYPPTSANLSRVAAGSLRLRQRPGPDNALGLVKFVFPNAYNVYLHGTPAQELFARARRDFSHGCIRVEDPPSLARFVLEGQDGWDAARIDAAMQGTQTLRVALARPVTVYVLYATAAAADDGTVHFYPDLYGHDAVLARALGASP